MRQSNAAFQTVLARCCPEMGGKKSIVSLTSQYLYSLFLVIVKSRTNVSSLSLRSQWSASRQYYLSQHYYNPSFILRGSTFTYPFYCCTSKWYFFLQKEENCLCPSWWLHKIKDLTLHLSCGFYFLGLVLSFGVYFFQGRQLSIWKK